ncbi:MAG: hypothetical protein RIS94_3114 [Pseudomonadota bacterium]|jgi:hypothetical protein
MADQKIERVIVGGDGATLDHLRDADFAAITGIRGIASTGRNGVSVAGMDGTAITQVYGVAVAGPKGRAQGGAGCMVFAYDGGSASGGDGAVAWARRGGPASTGAAGVAVALDGDAAGGPASLATAMRQTKVGVQAKAGPGGVAVVRNHTKLNPHSGPALAIADGGAVGIAFDGNRVSGAMGALLVASYAAIEGTRFAVGVVDGVTLMPGQAYCAAPDGTLVAIRD